jgi:hypothetical protein
MLMPGAAPEQMSWVDDLHADVDVHGESRSPSENSGRESTSRAFSAQIEVPTLVLHARGDQMNDFSEGGGWQPRYPVPGW